MSTRSHIQGMAMMMALVMLAIASSLAIGIWYNNQLSLARISNLQKSYQAKHYSQGMLLWASDILRQDYEQDNKQHDSSLDAWLQGIQGMLVEDAMLSGTLVGLNNRFNVNNLIVNGVISESHLIYFRNLLLALELDISLADKVVDWIDADQIPEPNGAEDFVYLAKSPSYQTSSSYFKHVQELSLLDGLSAEDFARLSPYISALPLENGVATRMNVNTMPPVLLSALHSLITNEKAVLLYKEGRADHLDVESFFMDSSIQFVLNDEIRNSIKPLISTKTLYLQASSLVQMEDSGFVMYALLHRKLTGEAQVISRSSSPYLPSALLK